MAEDSSVNLKWDFSQIPSQSGKVVLATGANSGIGFHFCRHMARAGAHVILACRNSVKLQAAAGEIRKEFPSAILTEEVLDVSCLASVRAFAEKFLKTHKRLDVLLNNAGIAGVARTLSADGFESHFATNHLGHFALTGLLLPLIVSTPRSRVVIVSSALHKEGKLNLDDLQAEKAYAPFQQYANTKLMNVLFMVELQRRLADADVDTLSVCAHPGFANTSIGEGMKSVDWMGAINAWAMGWFAQPAETGALPLLYAAVSPKVKPALFYGPDGFMEMRGFPTKVFTSPTANDEDARQKLWTISEQLSGVHFEFERRLD